MAIEIKDLSAQPIINTLGRCQQLSKQEPEKIIGGTLIGFLSTRTIAIQLLGGDWAAIRDRSIT